jgi:hypothetical protein
MVEEVRSRRPAVGANRWGRGHAAREPCDGDGARGPSVKPTIVAGASVAVLLRYGCLVAPSLWFCVLGLGRGAINSSATNSMKNGR